MDLPRTRQHFSQEVQQPDKQINLAKAALYIAQEEYPELDPDEYLNALDTMADELQERLPAQRYPLRMVQSINQYLYNDLGFRGNTSNYNDPRNSFLNDVIERRTGIPITLSLVYLEIARRIDFRMVGVGMPGHFLLRPNVAEMEICVDAFNRGEVLFVEDCQKLLAQIYGEPIELKPEFLYPVTHRQFLARMLTNLKMIYLEQQEWEKTLSTVERILLLFPDLPGELRDRCLLCYQIGDWIAASEHLATYLIQVPSARDDPAIRRLMNYLGRNI
ncbi:MAG: tetratricopeptide repeat protein [Chroococcidiopsidaceae cyanobacterium CP_BM_ER_R8_30]|nr:tetratricopeptide repeat protein [Chroococcidiopsidaceae cyanobacterium CP_BM_ER_R8_30]